MVIELMVVLTGSRNEHVSFRHVRKQRWRSLNRNLSCCVEKTESRIRRRRARKKGKIIVSLSQS